MQILVQDRPPERVRTREKTPDAQTNKDAESASKSAVMEIGVQAPTRLRFRPARTDRFAGRDVTVPDRAARQVRPEPSVRKVGVLRAVTLGLAFTLLQLFVA